MANIRDIAKEAAVSIGTASRVLSNDETFKVSPSTRERIHRIAKSLDYNPTTKSKRKKAPPIDTIKIGCILALTAEKYSDAFFTTILSSMEEECKNHNARITLIRNYNELKDPKILQEMCDSNLDGLILMERLPEDILSCLTQSIKHIVSIDHYHTRFNSVGFDQIESTYQAMNHLLECGYRRIAYIGGAAPDTDFLDTKRMIAYRESLRKANIPYDPTIIRDCHWDIDTCAQQVQEILHLVPRPDALFAGSDTLAQVALGKLFEYKLHCPDDIAVIGFNNLDFTSHLIPPLTTIDVPTREIGPLSILRLLELIQTNDPRLYSVFLPTTLIVRNSTKKEKQV